MVREFSIACGEAGSNGQIVNQSGMPAFDGFLLCVAHAIPRTFRRLENEAADRQRKFAMLQRGFKAGEERLREQLEEVLVSWEEG